MGIVLEYLFSGVICHNILITKSVSESKPKTYHVLSSGSYLNNC